MKRDYEVFGHAEVAPMFDALWARKITPRLGAFELRLSYDEDGTQLINSKRPIDWKGQEAMAVVDAWRAIFSKAQDAEERRYLDPASNPFIKTGSDE